MNSKHYTRQDEDKYAWEVIQEFEANLTPEQDKALDSYANLWFNVNKEYQRITGEWLQ